MNTCVCVFVCVCVCVSVCLCDSVGVWLCFCGVLWLSVGMILSVDLSVAQIDRVSIYQSVGSWRINNDFPFEFVYFLDPLTSIM